LGRDRLDPGDSGIVDPGQGDGMDAVGAEPRRLLASERHVLATLARLLACAADHIPVRFCARSRAPRTASCLSRPLRLLACAAHHIPVRFSARSRAPRTASCLSRPLRLLACAAHWRLLAPLDGTSCGPSEVLTG